MDIQKTINENMTKFLTNPPKLTNKDDLRLQAILKNNLQGQIVIIGSPFDHARKRSIKKGGQQNGPCCLRRFFHKVGPIYNSQYQIDLSQISVSDYGNIQVQQQEKNNPQKVITKIQEQILNILNNKKIPFILGGSKQCSLASGRAFHKLYNKGKHIIISSYPFLKRPFDNDKLTSDSLLTVLNTQFPQRQILIGPHKNYMPLEYEKNFEFVQFNQLYKQEQDYSQQKWQLGYSTKPVKKLAEIIQRQPLLQYHVTLSVDAIQRFNGCRDLSLHGIRPEEMTQIFYYLGQKHCIKSIDITQFNPSCQDYQSSLILVNLLYYFLMGLTKRTNIKQCK